MAQVVRNLIDNALKYGRPGGPVHVTLESSETGWVLIAIRDEGEGIAPEHLPRLTERFYRVDTALVAPRVSPSEWALSIGGMVDHPMELTFEDLLDREIVERDITLVCVSNEVGGRYAGTARWLGVPLRSLLEEAGVQPGAGLRGLNGPPVPQPAPVRAAVAQAWLGDGGGAFCRDSQDWRVMATRGMDEDDAEAIMRELLENELLEFPNRVMTLDHPSVGQEKGAGHHLRILSGLVMPIRVPQALEGLIVIFRKAGSQPFDRMDLGTARFIAEQVRLSFENAFKYEDAQRLVFLDDLTGLFNTRYLEHSLQTELKRAKRYKSHLSLLFIDLDHFKVVNDTHGHLVGSRLLIESAKIFKSCVREIDVIIRYGGDEFIVILVETDRIGAEKVAERIRRSMEEHVFKFRDDLELRVTCCIGIATFPDDAETKAELIHLSDKAMYRGKETTRNAVYSASSL
jgi:diguanylate cyclase (GGDEF)-like protein